MIRNSSRVPRKIETHGKVHWIGKRWRDDSWSLFARPRMALLAAGMISFVPEQRATNGIIPSWMLDDDNSPDIKTLRWIPFQWIIPFFQNFSGRRSETPQFSRELTERSLSSNLRPWRHQRLLFHLMEYDRIDPGIYPRGSKDWSLLFRPIQKCDCIDQRISGQRQHGHRQKYSGKKSEEDFWTWISNIKPFRLDWREALNYWSATMRSKFPNWRTLCQGADSASQEMSSIRWFESTMPQRYPKKFLGGTNRRWMKFPNTAELSRKWASWLGSFWECLARFSSQIRSWMSMRFASKYWISMSSWQPISRVSYTDMEEIRPSPAFSSSRNRKTKFTPLTSMRFLLIGFAAWLSHILVERTSERPPNCGFYPGQFCYGRIATPLHFSFNKWDSETIEEMHSASAAQKARRGLREGKNQSATERSGGAFSSLQLP